MIRLTALPTPLDTNQQCMIRKTVTSDHGLPCRRCLQDGRVGEEMLLLCYSPFEGVSPYTSPGPIFVHSNPCKQYQWDGAIPEQQSRRLLAIRGYDKDHMMMEYAVVDGKELMGKAEELLSDTRVEYLLVYYAGPGCFAVRVDKQNQ